MTFAELKAELDKLTPDQLAKEVLWWGDERGGRIVGVQVLDEIHVNMGEGFEALDAGHSEEDIDEMIATAGTVLTKGTPVLLEEVS